MTRIALLHTANVHVETFTKLLAEIDPAVEQRHAVQADWLSEARESGLTDKLRRKVEALLLDQAASADAVLCSCSTLGPVVDEVAAHGCKVLRVDRPLMQRAAEHDGTIVVALCLESTLTPSLALLRDAFAERGKDLRHQVVLCKEEWALFEAGRADAFGLGIAHKVRESCENIDDAGCVVLAQASMVVAEPHLTDLGIPVYASPRLAAEAAVQAAKSVASDQPEAFGDR